jgi:hypothetical protein
VPGEAVKASRCVVHFRIPTSIGVPESADRETPIGTATDAGASGDGQATWGLIVHGSPVQGVFVIADREFKRTDD